MLSRRNFCNGSYHLLSGPKIIWSMVVGPPPPPGNYTLGTSLLIQLQKGLRVFGGGWWGGKWEGDATTPQSLPDSINWCFDSAQKPLNVIKQWLPKSFVPSVDPVLVRKMNKFLTMALQTLHLYPLMKIHLNLTSRSWYSHSKVHKIPNGIT